MAYGSVNSPSIGSAELDAIRALIDSANENANLALDISNQAFAKANAAKATADTALAAANDAKTTADRTKAMAEAIRIDLNEYKEV